MGGAEGVAPHRRVHLSGHDSEGFSLQINSRRQSFGVGGSGKAGKLARWSCEHVTKGLVLGKCHRSDVLPEEAMFAVSIVQSPSKCIRINQLKCFSEVQNSHYNRMNQSLVQV